MTTYYVSANDGSDNNAGTSEGAPLATLQDAANLVQPGDTVEVMDGTYTGPGGGDVLDITTSGTSSAPITFEAAPGQTPVVNSSGAWNGIDVEASNIVINGFTVEGDAASYTLAQAQAQEDNVEDPTFDGNGITVQSPGAGVVPNHVTIENNTVFNEPGGGIDTTGADYLQILNNIVYDNANWSPYDNSGISVAASVNSDTNAGVHDIISGNASYDNADLIPDFFTGGITDGEGIILDSNTGYTGVIEVENNTTYGNSGPGIEDFLTNNAVIIGNTSYGNLTNPAAAGDGQIFINQSTGSSVTANISTSCFLAGTHIGTPRGEVAVEDLRPGDLVSLAGGGSATVRWLGMQTISTRFADPVHALPIRICAGALAEAVPCRDLLLSPGHALLINDLLMHAGALVNGTSVVRVTDMPETFRYYHVELPTHAVILAEGTPVESYLDGLEPRAFDNAADRAGAPEGAGELPYPRIKAHRQIPGALRAQLAARSAALGRGVSASAA
jgi:Hint domain